MNYIKRPWDADTVYIPDDSLSYGLFEDLERCEAWACQDKARPDELTAEDEANRLYGESGHYRSDEARRFNHFAGARKKVEEMRLMLERLSMLELIVRSGGLLAPAYQKQAEGQEVKV